MLSPTVFGLPRFTDEQQAARAHKQDILIGERLRRRNRILDRVIIGMQVAEYAGDAAGVVLGGGVVLTALKKGGKWVAVKTIAGLAAAIIVEQGAEEGLRAVGASEQTIRGARLAAAVVTLIILHRSGRLAALGPKPARPPVKARPHGELVGTLEEGYQANHLNQNAAFKDVIPERRGVAIAMRGDAITEPGTPHYEFHASMESFWNQYRPGGSLYGRTPTNAQYGSAVEQALRAAGNSPAEVASLSADARANRIEFGLSESDPVPRIPGRLGQARRP